MQPREKVKAHQTINTWAFKLILVTFACEGIHGPISDVVDNARAQLTSKSTQFVQKRIAYKDDFLRI
jgi:hypothetical protein